jgi:hypothetical protein
MDSKHQSPLNMLQRNLDRNQDFRSTFISAENSDSDSSESESCKIVLPKKRRKKVDTSQELLFQLIKQNKNLSKTKKKMYSIQADLDKEEIKSRYVRLDLNNAQVECQEVTEKLKQSNSDLHKVRTENIITKVFIALYFTYRIYAFFCTPTNPYAVLY